MDTKTLASKLMTLADPNQYQALNQLIGQTKQEQELRMYPDLNSPDPKRRQLANTRKMLSNAAIGATMGSDVSWAVPRPGSVESLSNAASGWKQPNLKSDFDYAMLTNDTDKIKQLLPAVPEGYLENKFGPEIYQKLLASRQAVNPAQQIIQNLAKGVIK